MGQISTALSNRSQDTQPSNINKKPRKLVLIVEAVNYAIIDLPTYNPTTHVIAYVPSIPCP